MINPYALLIAGVLALGLFGTGVSVGRQWSDGQRALSDRHIKEAVDAANEASAKAIAQIKVTNKTIQGEVRREVETHTVYSDCRLTPNGVQLANQALDGIKPAGDLKLPRFDATGK